jgi:hypothetical protein
VLGGTWPAARAVLPALVVMQVLLAVGIGANIGLRAMGEASRSLRTRIVISAALATGASVGAAFGDARGAAWGLALGAISGALLWWVSYRRGVARLVPAVVP